MSYSHSLALYNLSELRRNAIVYTDLHAPMKNNVQHTSAARLIDFIRFYNLRRFTQRSAAIG